MLWSTQNTPIQEPQKTRALYYSNFRIEGSRDAQDFKTFVLVLKLSTGPLDL